MATTGARFCTGCGTPLPADARFCGECGAPVARVAEAPPAARDLNADARPEPPPTASPELAGPGERRQVAILFADLSGFTRLSSELDAEELHALVGRVFEAIDGVVEDCGGTVDKHIGDAVMALFGAPVAYGDDPVRSVRAAFDIHAAMARLSDELSRTLEVHVAIASGEVVAGGLGRDGHEEYTVVGESVNLASRLNDRAEAGETLISDAVYRAVSSHFDCEPLGEVSVKGLDKPVRAWRVRAVQEKTPDRRRGPFIGRRSELGQFASVVDSCRETGSGQAILVRGEAGIGKSRLVEELEAIAEARGFTGHKGLILDFGVGKGQDAIPALVRSLLGSPPGGEDGVRQAAADRAVADGLLQPEQRAFLNDLLDLPQPTEMRAMYDAMDNATRNRGKQAAVAGLIRGASARAPIMLTVENIHWADALHLADLAAMASAVKDSPAVLVMASRTDGDPLDQAWRSATQGCPLLTIDLGPLRREEAVALAGEFIDATNRFVMRCIERAEGNPLFLEQLLRSAEAGEDDSVPASIQSLVLARMDRLPPADKRALQAASVIGERFSLDTLRHLLGEPDYGCTRLVEHYLVRPDGEDYLFAHALIHDGVYSSLLKTGRRDLHGRAAEWFARRDPVLRAEHLDRAEDAAAPGAYLEAAREQASDYRFDRAWTLAERGIELARDAADAYALTCLQGELLRDLGSVPESIEAYRTALDIAGDDAQRCRAWIGLAAGMRVLDRYDEALEALEQAETIARGLGLDLERSQVHYYRGSLYFPLGNIEGCLKEHEQALAHSRRAHSPEWEARALSGLGDAYYSQGRMITSLKHFRTCIELCRKHGFGRIEVGNRYMIAWNRLYLNEVRGALDDALPGVEAAITVGDQRAEIVARLAAGRVLFEMADSAAAEAQLQKGLELADALGATRFRPFFMIYLARIWAQQEARRGEVLRVMNEALDTSRRTGVTFVGPWVFSTLALVGGDPTERRRALEEGEKMFETACVGHNYLAFYRDAMEVALESADWDGVERYAAALEDYTRPEPLPLTDFFIARGRALAAHGQGGRGDATMAEIARLRDEARRVGLMLAVPALERALDSEACPAAGKIHA